jgi:hypothetical protein
MSRIFTRVLTDMGPRTTVFSVHEGMARLLSEAQVYDAIVILPDVGPYQTVDQLAKARGRTLDREISRRRKRRPVLVQPARLRITKKP